MARPVGRDLICSGATHEHNREDRDEHVKIHFANITPNGTRNFQKTTSGTYSYRSTPFDPLSVMNYGQTDFGKDDGQGGRMVTIEPLEPGLVIRWVAELPGRPLISCVQGPVHQDRSLPGGQDRAGADLPATHRSELPPPPADLWLPEDSCFLADTLLEYTQYQDSSIIKTRKRLREQVGGN